MVAQAAIKGCRIRITDPRAAPSLGSVTSPGPSKEELAEWWVGCSLPAKPPRRPTAGYQDGELPPSTRGDSPASITSRAGVMLPPSDSYCTQIAGLLKPSAMGVWDGSRSRLPSGLPWVRFPAPPAQHRTMMSPLPQGGPSSASRNLVHKLRYFAIVDIANMEANKALFWLS